MARKGIFKRGDTWWIRYADLTGKIIRKSTGSTRFSYAETMLLNEKKSVREYKSPNAVKIENHLFSELAEKYKAWVHGRQACAALKKYTIDKLVERYGTIPLRRFNTALVEQLQTDLMSKGLKKKKAKPTTPGYINRVLNILRHMFTKAVEWEMVESDVLQRIRRVKQLRENRRLRFLSIEEAKALVSVCDEHLKPIVMAALNTGMRKSEILKLRWDNVDLVHGFILLDKTKNGERREIPINDTLKVIFQRLPRSFVDVSVKGKNGEVQIGEDGKTKTTRELVPYVFHDPKTFKPYVDLKRSFTTALKTATIADFHFHDLRHTFASQLVMSGADLVAVKELLGHKDIKMTLRYAHLAPAHKRKAINILDNLLNSSPNCATANCTITAHSTEKESVYVD